MKRPTLRSKKSIQQMQEQTTLSILIFSVNGKEYAFPVKPIQEIINCTGYTELPPVSNSADGVVGLRGVGVPVFDMHSIISHKSSTINKRSCIIILDMSDPLIAGKKQNQGLLVESVSVVLEIEQRLIEEAPHSGDKGAPDLFSGMIQYNGKFILIINENKIFKGQNDHSQSVNIDNLNSTKVGA